MFTINCKGKLITTDIPLVMGIINATPDSFYEGHLLKSNEQILALVAKMVLDGADIIDVGGVSTKPGSVSISIQQEIDRVIPVIEAIYKVHPTCVISIDTYQSKVAIAAVQAGASIVNDVSAGEADEEMIPTIASLKNIPYIAMHKRGTALTMQSLTNYNNVVDDVMKYFVQKVAQFKQAGILDVVIDPGFGFAKTIEQNFELLKNLSAFSILDKAILVGVSRKSMVYKSINATPADALNGTTALHTIALTNGANILRVHDVKEAKEAITLWQLCK